MAGYPPLTHDRVSVFQTKTMYLVNSSRHGHFYTFLRIDLGDTNISCE